MAAALSTEGKRVEYSKITSLTSSVIIIQLTREPLLVPPSDFDENWYIHS